MAIKRIAAGHYVGPRGEVRNVKSNSGAPHTRGAANWLVTKADGRTELVPSLAVAKLLIDGPKLTRVSVDTAYFNAYIKDAA